MKTTKNKIDVRFEYLVPWHFRLAGFILVIVALAGFMVNPLLALLFIFVGVFLITAYSGTIVDLARNKYNEYNAYFFIKSGEDKSFHGIEKIFINPGKSRQKIYTAHTLNSKSFENITYNAYLKFENGNKIQLLKSKNKTQLLGKLEPIATFLKTQIEDNTI